MLKFNEKVIRILITAIVVFSWFVGIKIAASFEIFVAVRVIVKVLDN